MKNPVKVKKELALIQTISKTVSIGIAVIQNQMLRLSEEPYS